MDETSQVLARNLASLTQGRKRRRTRALTTDRTLQALAADLVAARVAAGMTQEEVAARMWTTLGFPWQERRIEIRRTRHFDTAIRLY